MVSHLRSIFQVKIALNGSAPPIWRKILISNTMNLYAFHQAVQIAMGWTDSHLHQFIDSKSRYGIIDPDFNFDDDLLDELDFKVKDILKFEGDSILYEYDFGDDWEHSIILEKIQPYDKEKPLPFCITGRKGCPPEDVGGIWGYKDFLKKWSNRSHPENQELREWAGDYFDPDNFDKNKINEIYKMHKTTFK